MSESVVISKRRPLHWTKFRWERYESDLQLQLCSLAAQGLWMRMLCLMHRAEPYGHLLLDGRPVTSAQLAHLVRTPEPDVIGLLDELERNGVFSRTDEGVVLCRCMVRDWAEYLRDCANGKRGGNPALKPQMPAIQEQVNGGVNPPDNARTKKVSEPTVQADAKTADLFGQADNPPPSAAKLIFTEGLDILADLREKSVKANNASLRKDMGKFRKAAKNDDERLLDILRRAKAQPPADVFSWVMGCLKGPKLVVTNGNVVAADDDPWGITAFCQSHPKIGSITDPVDQRRGKWIYDGTIIDATAREVARAAEFPASKRIDWSPLLEWLDLKLHPTHHIVPAVKRQASGFSEPITSLRFFDKAMRERRVA